MAGTQRGLVGLVSEEAKVYRAGDIMSPAMKRARTATVVTAIAGSLVFGTPEIITQLFMFFVLAAVILAVLLVFLRIPSVATWQGAKQRVAIWLMAAATGVCAGLLLLPHAIRQLPR